MVPSEDDRPERAGGSGDAGAAAAGPVVEVLGWSAAPPEATRATAGESRGAGDEPGPGDAAVPDDEAAVGGPDDDVECRRRSGPRLRLDWRRFAYAGKFATPETGVVVV